MTIESIDTYTQAIEFFRDYAPEKLEDMDSETLCTLEHFDDFEAERIAVINGETVYIYDGLTGDTSGTPIAIAEFISGILEYISEL